MKSNSKVSKKSGSKCRKKQVVKRKKVIRGKYAGATVDVTYTTPGGMFTERHPALVIPSLPWLIGQLEKTFQYECEGCHAPAPLLTHLLEGRAKVEGVKCDACKASAARTEAIDKRIKEHLADKVKEINRADLRPDSNISYAHVTEVAHWPYPYLSNWQLFKMRMKMYFTSKKVSNEFTPVAGQYRK